MHKKNIYIIFPMLGEFTYSRCFLFCCLNVVNLSGFKSVLIILIITNILYSSPWVNYCWTAASWYMLARFRGEHRDEARRKRELNYGNWIIITAQITEKLLPYKSKSPWWNQNELTYFGVSCAKWILEDHFLLSRKAYQEKWWDNLSYYQKAVM